MGERFTGSMFEVLADRERSNEITAQDLMAVTTLSVNAPARPAIWLTSPEGSTQVRSLLRQVPLDVNIWDDDAEPLLASEGPLQKLWDLLDVASWPHKRPGNGLGRTLKSKLLAAKRPRLVPVLDDRVVDALPTPTTDYWTAFRAILVNDGTRQHIERITSVAPPHVSLLRRMDVVLWMLNKP